MKHTWDPNKNDRNIRKHGIDFVDVEVMFERPMVLFPDAREDYGEGRWIGIGWLDAILAVVVFVEPGDDTRRIISARKATAYERKIYRQEIPN
jgi:uncharacterized protein